MIQLLVQLPDADTLTELLDAKPLAQVARRTECFVFLVQDGQFTPVPLDLGSDA